MDCKCYTSFVYIILRHAIDSFNSHVLFLEVKNVIKKIVFKQDGGQFVKSQKNCIFVLPSLSIKLSNDNWLYKPKSSQRLVLWDSHLNFDTQLSAAEEYMLCVYTMVVDYILEINLTNLLKNKIGFIHF